MKKNYVVFPALILGCAAALQAQAQATPPATPPVKAPATASTSAPAPSAGITAVPSKIGLINLRDALAKTADGQKAALDLEEKFASRKTALQRRQIDMKTKQEQLDRGGTTMSEAAKTQLAREIDTEGKNFKRDVEDLNTDAQEEENKVMMGIWQQMQPVIQQYAMQNGFAAVLDVGNEQSPVLWASNGSFITEDIVNLYNQAHPAGSKPKAPTPAPPAGHQNTPPPSKKQ